MKIYLYNPYEEHPTVSWPAPLPVAYPIVGWNSPPVIAATALYVWGATLGNGTNSTVLAASPNGQQNAGGLMFYFPAPEGEAFDVTITTTDAADDLVWDTLNPGPTDTPVLGDGTSSYTFTTGQALYSSEDQFTVGATAGNTTYDCLSYTFSATMDAAASASPPPMGSVYLSPPSDVQTNKASNIASQIRNRDGREWQSDPDR